MDAVAASEKLVDLAAEGFDAGVRLGQLIGADMVAIRMTPPLRFLIVGSPAYIARRGRPERPDDLREHACLRLRRSSGSLALWSLNDRGQALEIAVSGPLIANDFPTALGAAIEGLGLAQVPEPIATAPLTAGKLVPVLESFAPTTPGSISLLSGGPANATEAPRLRRSCEESRKEESPEASREVRFGPHQECRLRCAGILGRNGYDSDDDYITPPRDGCQASCLRSMRVGRRKRPRLQQGRQDRAGRSRAADGDGGPATGNRGVRCPTPSGAVYRW